jgi:hypothetical protein
MVQTLRNNEFLKKFLVCLKKTFLELTLSIAKITNEWLIRRKRPELFQGTVSSFARR